MRIIKRYANRKLYDTEEKRYVTLSQLAERLKDGEELQIIDNESGRDVTAVAMAQIITDAGRKGEGEIPTSFLVDLLRRSGGALSEAVKRSSQTISQVASVAEDEVEKRIKSLARAGEISQKEAGRILSALKKRADDNRRVLETRVERGINAALKRLDIPSRSDLDRLTRRVEDLAGLVEEKTGGKKKTSRKKKSTARSAKSKAKTSSGKKASATTRKKTARKSKAKSKAKTSSSS